MMEQVSVRDSQAGLYTFPFCNQVLVVFVVAGKSCIICCRRPSRHLFKATSIPFKVEQSRPLAHQLVTFEVEKHKFAL